MKDARYIVVAIRHFINGEHHWFAPEAGMPYGDDPVAFGAFGENRYSKPLFSTVKSAEDYAMSLRHGEWVLAQWEDRRPTFVVVEDEVYLKVMESDSAPFPAESEGWTDAEAADYERTCDCDEFMTNRIWDSDSDEVCLDYFVRRVNAINGLSAWIEDGYVCVEKPGECKEAVADAIEATEGFPRALKFVKSDESANLAWFDIEEA